MQVNRYLEDKAMDAIDHALGRPVDPMVETYRNRYVTGANDKTALAFRTSSHWREYRTPDDTAGFEVTAAGREALRDHLKEINDPWRLYVVSYDGYDMEQVGKSRSNAKYRKWCAITDAFPDLPFTVFCSTARVRLARPNTPESE